MSNPRPFTRKELNNWAEVMGTKRKWFGLETNKMLRKRLIEMFRKGYL